MGNIVKFDENGNDSKKDKIEIGNSLDSLIKVFYLRPIDICSIALLSTILFLICLFISLPTAFWASAEDSSFLDERSDSQLDIHYLYQIDINRATLSELTILPKIGEITALKIIAKREEKGGFTSLEEIKEVKGIGDKTFNKFKKYLVINKE